MSTIEDRLRSAFEAVAGPVVPRPDPLGRLLARRTRRRWRRGISATAVAVATALTGGVLIVTQPGGPARPEPAPMTDIPHAMTGAPMTEWTRRLIDTPTRGNLAGDAGYVQQLTAELRAGTTPTHAMIDPALTRVKVLALARMGDAKIVVAAFYNDDRAAVAMLRAAPESAPAELATMPWGGMTGDLEPFVFTVSQAEPSPDIAVTPSTFALAPAGCQVSTSDTVTYGPDGTAVRTWQEHGDHLIAPGELSATWWRVSCEGRVRFEGRENLGFLPATASSSAPIAPGAGGADATLLARASAAWRAVTEHAHAGEPTVVWAGTPPAGRPTVVVTGRAAGGGVLVAALTDSPPAQRASTAWYYAGRAPVRGVTADPGPEFAPVTTSTATGTDLVAVRLPAPDPAPQLGDRILVVVPQRATDLQVQPAGGGTATTVPVSGGIAVLTRAAPTAALTLRAVDGTGQILAEGRFSEPDAEGQFLGEPYIDRW